MNNKLSHFAIYTDDMNRAKKFYSELFGWKFNSYGPSDFNQIKLEDSDQAPPIGALQSRKYSPLDEKVNGFECSIAVENIDHIAQAVIENGGKILMAKTMIPHVGWVIKFLDTEGNLVCAIQYDNEVV